MNVKDIKYSTVETSLERSKNECQTDYLQSYFYKSRKFGEDRSSTFSDNFPPTGTVKNERREINSSRTHMTLGRHTRWV